MATLKKTRVSKKVKYASFVFDISAADNMVDVNGVSKTFAAGGAFDVIPLPLGTKLVGGDITVRTVSNDSGTATLAVGDENSATRYLGATNIKAAARTSLALTGAVWPGKSLRITVANQNGDATTGVVEVNIMYVTDGAADEVLATSQVTA
jgi:hypothetical protein